MRHPDEGTIHAWLDGALRADEARALEAHVAECERCRAAVAEARGLVAGASRILAALDAVPTRVAPPAAGGVTPLAARRERPRGFRVTRFRAAAAVLILAAGSLVVGRELREGAAKRSSEDALLQPAVARSTPLALAS